MHICVIDNTDTKSSVDFTELFCKIDKSVNITVYKINDTDLLDKINLIKKSLDGIILTGSSRRILNDSRPAQLPPSLLDMKIPILGICYGFQWMAYTRGGNLSSFDNNELKNYNKYITISQPFIVSKRKYKFLHHDYVYKVPNTFTEVLRLSDMIVMAYEKRTGHIGVQFHPEKKNASALDFFQKWLIWLNVYNKNERIIKL
jgi:GMP synthase (glutamine-hydrolysing)